MGRAALAAGPRRVGRALILLLVALAGSSWVSPVAPAAAQGADQLEVVSQSGFVPSEGTFEAVLAWDGPVLDLDLQVRIFQLVGDEAQLDRSTRAGPLNQLDPVPLSALARDDEGNLVVQLPIRSVPLPEGDPGRVYLPDPGVYPVQLEIVDRAGTTVASVMTELLRLPVDVEATPVPVSVVLVVGGGGLALGDAVDLLERFPQVAVTVLLDPSTVAGTEAEPALVARLREAVDDRAVVAVSPVPLDVSALAEIDRLDLYDTVRRSGAEQVTARLDRDVTVDLIPIEQLPTAEAAAHLADPGVALLAPTGTTAGVLETGRGPLPVVSADEELMDELADGRGHRVLARLALRYREGEVAPVLFTTEPGSGVTASDVAVLLDGLARPGIVEAVPVDQVADAVTGRLEPGERPLQDLRPAADLLAATVDDLRDYAGFHVDGPLPPQYLESRVVAALATDVAPEQRIDRLASVRRDIAEAFDVVSLPEGRTVNLAARTSQLPLTVTSDAPGVRRVRIAFASDKLTFPGEGGDSRVVEIEPGVNSFDFTVESRSLGVSPLDVTISSPDGDRVLTRTRITIRSTAVPGLGLLLSGAALVFLLVWWVLHFTRRRREVPGAVPAERVA